MINEIRETELLHYGTVLAKAKHILACCPLRNKAKAKRLDEYLSQYKTYEPPPDFLIRKLDELIKDSDVLNGDEDNAYIRSCVRRYQRGIPIHLGRLMKYQRSLETGEANLQHLIGMGLISIDDENRIQVIGEPALFLSGPELALWPRNPDGTLVIERRKLKEINVGLAQRMYMAMMYVRYRNVLRFNVDFRGKHHEWPNPFGSSTGREAPKGASFNYLSKPIRNHLLYPKKGKQIFVLDYCSQEPASLAALAGDHTLWSAYQNGDLYLELQSRSQAFTELDRVHFKRLCIAHLYGITSRGIAKKFGVSPTVAAIWDRELRVIFKKVDAYLDEKVKEAMKQGFAEVYGFRRTVAADTRVTTIRNFYVQAVCSYMLRKLCIKLEQLNIPLIFAIHDCIGVQTHATDLETYALAEKAMADVSEEVLGEGYRLRCDCEYHVINNH
ncbi:hypothetical protein D1216_06665 [Vibrio parahaemolyticus]|uniref:DNA polymerase n=1 Tax=Vibrio diabolicus TaxID=50719 RepID=UPI001A29ED2C|nr:hypothetical protein [Vibrio parahaemolyticus]HAS6854892.1 hypothetical protein [Vibrio parahaemolyticus]